MGTLIGKLLVGLGLDTSGLDKGTKKADKKLTYLQRQTKTASAGIVKSMSAMGVAFAIGAIVKDAARTVAEFDQKVSNLAATSGRSRSQIGALIENAKAVGKVSAFTATQVLDLQTELAKLGNTESEIISMTKAVGDFSIAVGATTSEAAILTGGVLKSFGKTAQETESVVSSLAVATTKSALDFQKLNAALPIVGTAADQSGVSLNRTVALLGVLSDRNLSASRSGNALKNIFLILKEKGLTYNQAMEQISSSTDSLNEANKIFGKENATVAAVLAESSSQADILEKSITGVDGALKKMTDERLDTVSGQLTLLGSAWEGFVLSIEDGSNILSVAFKGVIKSATGLISSFSELPITANATDRFIFSFFGTDEERDRINKKLEASKKTIEDITAETQKRNGDILAGLGSELFKDFKLPTEVAAAVKDFNGDAVNEIERLQKAISDLQPTQIEKLKAELKRLQDKGKVAVPTISSLTSEINALSIAYIKGGSKDGNIIDSITGKQAKIIELNKELSQSAELLQRLKEGIAPGGSRETIAAPESLPNKSTGVISEVFSDSSIDTANKLGKEIKTVAENIKETNAAAEESKSRFDNLADVINTGVSDSLVGLGENLGAALAHANSFGEGITNVFKGALDSLLGVLISVGKLAISTGITVDAIKTALKSLSGTAAIIGGVALVALATAVRSKLSGSVPQLAGGGVIDQPTFAMLGEYPGAANNPEIAAPESKLRNIFSGELAKMGNVGNASSKVFGNDIYLANKRAKTYIGRTG